MQKETINNEENNGITNEEVIIVDQMPEYPEPENPSLDHKKNLLRLLLLSGLGLVTLVLLGISFFFVLIKI